MFSCERTNFTKECKDGLSETSLQVKGKGFDGKNSSCLVLFVTAR